jgi:exonuclease III
MKIATLNIRGISKAKIQRLWISLPQNIEAIALQETHTDLQHTKNLWGNLKNWHHFWSYGNGAKNGVAILLNKTYFPLPPPPENVTTDNKGRWIKVKANNNRKETHTIASIYAPSTEKERETYLKALNIDIPDDHPAWIAGDWNTVVNKNNISTSNENWKRSHSATAFVGFITRHQLRDTTS